MARLLITDDDPAILGLIRAILEPEGFEIVEAHNGIEAVEAVEHSDFDLLILDIMMPEMDGLEACRRIRQFSDVPIIFLSAKDEEADTVIGFALGADDYITKPFAIEELLARIRVALKRNRSADRSSSVLTAGKLTLDKDAHTVTYDGQTVDLTNREFLLLETLMENRSIVLSRDTLLEKVWGYDYMGETNVVDVYIYYLRNKIDDRFGEKIIETVRSVGYVIK